MAGTPEVSRRRRILQNQKAPNTRRCNFSGCTITAQNKPDHVKLHRVPKDPMRRAFWLKTMGLKPDENADTLRM